MKREEEGERRKGELNGERKREKKKKNCTRKAN